MNEILDLSTIVKRATVNITSKRHPKGKQYELVNLADLGPYEYAVIVDRNGTVEKLKKLKKLTAAQTRQIARILDEMALLVCPTLEPAVLAELTKEQKEMLVLAWSMHINSAEGDAAADPPVSRRTTGASSRGSKRSTAATRKRGSTARRGS